MPNDLRNPVPPNEINFAPLNRSKATTPGKNEKRRVLKPAFRMIGNNWVLA